MDAIINILFDPLPNAIMTVLAGISLIYWLFTMLLGDGFEFGESSIDFEGADVQDIDVPEDAVADLNQEGEPSFIAKAMDFINIGKAPFMVIVTLFKLIGWIITIISSLAFNLSQYGWKSVLILVPILLLTYLLMHYVTIPVVNLYKKVGYMGEEALEFLGRTGNMKSSIQGDHIGAAEFIINQDIIRLNVKSQDGIPLNYGDSITVTKETPDKKYYIVRKEINLENFNQ